MAALKWDKELYDRSSRSFTREVPTLLINVNEILWYAKC